jgi:hypothetical protein
MADADILEHQARRDRAEGGTDPLDFSASRQLSPCVLGSLVM